MSLGYEMTFEDRLATLWQARFWDAIGCGYSESYAESYAQKAVDAARKARPASRSAITSRA